MDSRYLIVQEREAGDEIVKSIKSWRDKVLAVVTEEFQDCQHGQAAVLQLVQLEIINFTTHGFLARIKVTEEAIVVDGTDGEEHLHPSKGWDGFNGGDTVGDRGAWDTGSNVKGEAEDFRNNVSDDGELRDTSVFELGRAVLVERFLVNVAGKAKRI